MTDHPTLAVAAPGNPAAGTIPLWLDFDGATALGSSRLAAFVLCAGGPVFRVIRHDRGVHVLAPRRVPIQKFLRTAEEYGADMETARIAVQRGTQFLRVSARPYDAPPRIEIWGALKSPTPQNFIVDAEQMAAVGLYLAAILPNAATAATYMQDRPEEGR